MLSNGQPCPYEEYLDIYTTAFGENGNYYVSTLNNTVLASTRAVIAFIENNYNEDGSINIPEALRPYMGGKDIIIPKK